MNIYNEKGELLPLDKACAVYGEIRIYERLDEADDWFKMHPHSEKVTWKDGMEIRKED